MDWSRIRKVIGVFSRERKKNELEDIISLSILATFYNLEVVLLILSIFQSYHDHEIIISKIYWNFPKCTNKRSSFFPWPSWIYVISLLAGPPARCHYSPMSTHVKNSQPLTWKSWNHRQSRRPARPAPPWATQPLETNLRCQSQSTLNMENMPNLLQRRD